VVSFPLSVLAELQMRTKPKHFAPLAGKAYTLTALRANNLPKHKISGLHAVHNPVGTETQLRGLSPRANYTDTAKSVPTFADIGCRVVSVTDPHGRTLGFLDRTRYFFCQEASQMYSRG
jgi:hypothetical protein